MKNFQLKFKMGTAKILIIVLAVLSLITISIYSFYIKDKDGLTFVQNISNSSEKQELFYQKEFLDKINVLPLDDINSITKAQDILENYLKQSTNLKGKAFENYRIFFFKAMKLQENSESKPYNFDDYCMVSAKQQKIIENYYKKYGILVKNAECAFLLIEDTKYTRDRFSKYLPEEWQEFLDFRVKENGWFWDDGAVAMTWKDLKERIIFWENFVRKYPDNPELNEIKTKLDDYYSAFIYAPYGYDDNEQLEPKLKEEYVDFLTNHKDSAFYSNLQIWYDKLKKNNFKANYAYIEKFDIAQPYKVDHYNKEIYDGFTP